MESDLFWIAFGDIHEQVAHVGRIPNLSNAQGVLISGDITNRGTRSRGAALLSEVERINPRIYAQIGNMDQNEVAEYLEERGWNVHARITDLGHGVSLVGIGYSTPTPFNTPSEVSEEQMAGWISAVSDRAKSLPHIIFMPHTPPLKTKADRLPAGASVGSAAVRRFIEEVQPEVCITGHIHEAKSMDQIGRTRIANPGQFGEGGYALIRLNDGQLMVELKQL